MAGKNAVCTTVPNENHGIGKKKNEWIFVNPYLIVGAIGTSFGFSWFFSMLLTPSFLFGFTGDAITLEMMHLVFTVAVFLGYGAIWIFSDYFQKHRGILLVVSFICATSCTWGWGLLPLGLPLLMTVSIGAGLGIASLMVLWIEFICAHLRGRTRSALASTLALSFLWYGGTVFIDERFIPLFITGFAVVSAALYTFLRYRFSLMDTMPSISAQESDGRLKITWRPSLLTIMGSVAQGFALYWLIMPSVRTFSISLLVLGFSFVVVCLLLVDSVRSFHLKESFIRRLFLPVLAACILPLFFVPQDMWIWPCILAFLFSLLPYTSAVFATCEHIVRCNLSAIRVFSWGRLSSTGGLVFGLLAGWFAFSSNMLGSITLSVWVVIVVMFFILVSTTVSAKSFYPGEEHEQPAIVRIGSQGEIIADYETKKQNEGGVKFFHLKCDAVAREYGLSNRQTEVLHLLAKGRNAEYIQKQLVISPHTAKAHIYNIYQKTGSHSRQDLMDLVENMEVDEHGHITNCN